MRPYITRAGRIWGSHIEVKAAATHGRSPRSTYRGKDPKNEARRSPVEFYWSPSSPMREARPTRPERATPVRKPRRPPASQDQVGEGRDQPPRRVSRHRTRMASSWATHLYCPVLPLPCLFHSFLHERDGPSETHVTAGMRDTSTWQLDVGRVPSTSHPEDRGIGFQAVHHTGINAYLVGCAGEVSGPFALLSYFTMARVQTRTNTSVNSDRNWSQNNTFREDSSHLGVDLTPAYPLPRLSSCPRECMPTPSCIISPGTEGHPRHGILQIFHDLRRMPHGLAPAAA